MLELTSRPSSAARASTALTGLGRAQPLWGEHGRPCLANLRGSSPNATDPSGFMVYPGYPAGLVISGMNYAGLGLGALNLGLPNPFAGSPSGTYRDVPADAARAATTTPATQSPANGVGQRDGVVGPAGAVLDQLQALEQRLAEYQQELLTQNPRVLWELFKRAWPFRRMLLDAKPTLRPGAAPAPAAGARAPAPPAPPIAAVRLVAPSSRALGRALEAAGHVRPPNSAAHHIVAGSAPGAAPARAILDKVGISINEAANGVFLPVAQHTSLHTATYYRAVERALAGVTTRAQAEQVLQSIGRGLQAGRFP